MCESLGAARIYVRRRIHIRSGVRSSEAACTLPGNIALAALADSYIRARPCLFLGSAKKSKSSRAKEEEEEEEGKKKLVRPWQAPGNTSTYVECVFFIFTSPSPKIAGRRQIAEEGENKIRPCCVRKPLLSPPLR